MLEGTPSYYRGALATLRFIEARRPTKRRFGPDADATWSAFRGDLSTSARIDLLLRDANTQWPGAFGAHAVYDLAAIAEDEAFGAQWTPLDDVDAEQIWRNLPAPAANVHDVLAEIARAWHLTLTPMTIAKIAPSDQLLVIGPSAIAATIEAFSQTSDLDWHEQVTVAATPPAHRQLAAAGAALLNSGKPTRFGAHPTARRIVSPDAYPSDT